MGQVAVAPVLGVLGVVLNILLTWPQVVRVVRHGPQGVSLGTVVMGFNARVLWSVYGVRAQDLALFLGQAPVAAGFATIAFVVARERGGVKSIMVLLAILAASVAAAAGLIMALPKIFTVVAIIVAAVVNLPQMIGTLRDPVGASGVSAAMYWFTAAASATWLSYGVVVGDLAISAAHVVLLPTAVLTAVAVTRARRGAAVD